MHMCFASTPCDHSALDFPVIIIHHFLRPITLLQPLSSVPVNSAFHCSLSTPVQPVPAAPAPRVSSPVPLSSLALAREDAAAAAASVIQGKRQSEEAGAAAGGQTAA